MDREEAIEKVREMKLSPGKDAELIIALHTLIPELKESEDERLRKLLVWQVHRNIEDETNDLKGSVYDGIKGHDPDLEESIEDWKKCLAYLEKQKEQKPVEVDERMKHDKHFLSICQHLETLISESKNEGDKESIDKDYKWLCEFYRKSRFVEE